MRLTKTYLRRLIKEEVNLILKEQEDGAANQEEGPGQTEQEAEALAPRKRMVTWASKLRPQVYRQFLQDVKRAVDDVQARGSSSQRDVVNDQFYKIIVKLVQLANRGRVTPQQAMKFENMMTSDINFNLERYGYPVTAKMAGASL